MTSFEIEAGDYTLTCKIGENGAVVTDIRGNGSVLDIPKEIICKDKPYFICEIAKKAALACKTLRDVRIPETVTKIGDWAFAQCGQLECVSIPADILFGVGVFEGCQHLYRIRIQGKDEDTLPRLLACCVTEFQAEDLIGDNGAGQDDWYEKWDQRLLSFLQEADEEGYQTMVLCGEEDIRKDIPQYVMERKMDKCDLCMTRLFHKKGLSEDMENRITEYILRHIKGCEQEAAWELMKGRYGNHLEYYELLADIGGITKDNIEAMIEDLDEKHAEAKAYLIQYKQGHFGVEDVFAGFEL